MNSGLERGYSYKGDTWPKVLQYNYEKYGQHRRAMRYKHYGIWQPYTWTDYYLGVKHLALGLLAIGFTPEDRLLIIGDNAPQWYYAELAVQSVHGISVGLYSDLNPAEIRYIGKDCEARFAVVEDQEQVDKFLDIRGDLPHLEKVIYWNYKGLAHYKDDLLIGYRQVEQLGRSYEKENPGIFERNVESGKADDVCAVVYTSGTTGDRPKGALHTFETLRAGAEFHLRLDPWFEDDNVVPYLPPSWMTEQWLGVGCHLLSGCVLNFAEAPETQQRDSRETSPSIVWYSARLWEGQASSVHARILNTGAIKRFAFHKLMPAGYRTAESRHRKEKTGIRGNIGYLLSDWILFRPIRKSLGLSNARICYSSGSVLSADAMRFYHALNIPLKSLYETTEGGPLTGCRHDDIDIETVGPAHEGTEVRITGEGELVYRTPGTFLGYYNDPAGSLEVLKDGWFYSGDSAFIREDGKIVFRDRLKHLITLDNEHTLAPQDIESRMRFSPYVKDAWVLAGPEGAYVSAVVIIDYDNVSRWAGQRRVAFSSFAELARAPEVYDLMKQEIHRVNRTLPEAFRIRKYVNLHKEFDPDEGELTRTRKLRRAFLEERYRALMDALYSEKTDVTLTARTEARDGRAGTTENPVHIESVEGAG